MLSTRLAASLLTLCGYAEMATGALLMVLMAASLWDADAFLTHFFGLPEQSLGKLGGNSWAQAAVAFGMHAYADLANGLEQVRCLQARTPLPRVVSLWNSTRAFISFCFLTVLARGLYGVHGDAVAAWPSGALVLLAVLALDATLVRPLAVLCQRALEDARPLPARLEAREWAAFSPLQRFCRGVFYYEAVLSGTSGIAYMLAPALFPWLFAFPAADTGSAVLFGLSAFGSMVAAFGLYQMNADIDTRSGHIAWWLFLDIVWLYVYWAGVKSVHGPWNPFTLSGARPFCHIAFHADSTLALARTVFLYTVFTRGRGGEGVPAGAAVAVSAGVAGATGGESPSVGRSSSAKRR